MEDLMEGNGCLLKTFGRWYPAFLAFLRNLEDLGRNGTYDQNEGKNRHLRRGGGGLVEVEE